VDLDGLQHRAGLARQAAELLGLGLVPSSDLPGRSPPYISRRDDRRADQVTQGPLSERPRAATRSVVLD
jgi:hypothetical protein